MSETLKRSAGLMMYRKALNTIEIFLVHPGGPYWSKKDEGFWTIKQKTGKIVLAWAFEGNCEPTSLVSNTCEIEWPPRSGKKMLIPEVDRGEWFSLDRVREFLRMEQFPLLDRLMQRLPSLD